VRADHPLRRINAVLDLSFERPAVEQFYGNNGHVGIDPVVLVKRMFLMFLDDVASYLFAPSSSVWQRVW
jgi:hypothetical protein